MKPSQQRVYDILKNRYPKWTNKAQLRKMYYEDDRESHDCYMGRLLHELDKMLLIEKRTAEKNGEKCTWSEYRITNVDHARMAQPEKASKGTVTPFSTEKRQVNEPCKVCGSYYRIIATGDCNICV